MSDFQQLIESNRLLNETVEKKIGEIDQRVEEAEAEFNQNVNSIRQDFPFFRVTKNQELKISGGLTAGTVGTPDGWNNRDSSKIKCEIIANTESGVSFDQKHPEVQALFQDIYGQSPTHMQPNFAIIKVTVEAGAGPFNYTIYQGPIPNGFAYTIGSLLKLVSGTVRIQTSSGLEVPNDGKWHEYLKSSNAIGGGANYVHAPHFHASEGSVFYLALPGVVAGIIPTGKWGYFVKPNLEHEG